MNSLNLNRTMHCDKYRILQDTFSAFEDNVDLHADVHSFLNRRTLQERRTFRSKVSKKMKSFASTGILPRPEYNGAVEIVIPLYGDSPSIEKCLQHIERSKEIQPRVILVSNNAPADVIERTKSFSCVQHVIINATNLGFGQGCHQGIEASTGDHVILLNSDAFVDEYTLAYLMEDLASDPNVGAAISLPIEEDRKLVEFGRYFQHDGHTFGFGGNHGLDEPRFSYIRQVPYSSFVCVAINKEVYLSVGGFDPEFSPAYYEDSDLSLRMFYEGFKVLVDYRSKVHHVLGESSSKLSSVDVIIDKNRKKFCEKHADFLKSIPSDIDPGNYPHEAELMMSIVYGETNLIVQKRYSHAALARQGIVPGHGYTVLCEYMSEKDRIKLQNTGVQVNIGFDKKMHYWFRERIGLFDKIYIEDKKLFEQLTTMFVCTQPFASYAISKI